MTVRIFAGLSGDPEPFQFYAALRADGYPDTSMSGHSVQECVRFIVDNHRGAMRSRRADRHRQELS